MQQSIQSFREHQEAQNRLEQRMRDRGNELFTHDFLNRPFPVNRLSLEWVECALMTVKMVTHRSLNIAIEDHRRLCELSICDFPNLYITFVDFAALSNSLEHFGPRLLPIDPSGYWDLAKEVQDHIAFYSEELTKCRQTVQAQIDAEFKKEREALAKKDPGRPAGSQLKPVAEA